MCPCIEAVLINADQHNLNVPGMHELFRVKIMLFFVSIVILLVT